MNTTGRTYTYNHQHIHTSNNHDLEGVPILNPVFVDASSLTSSCNTIFIVEMYSVEVGEHEIRSK